MFTVLGHDCGEAKVAGMSRSSAQHMHSQEQRTMHARWGMSRSLLGCRKELEHKTLNPWVMCSSPTLGAICRKELRAAFLPLLAAWLAYALK